MTTQDELAWWETWKQLIGSLVDSAKTEAEKILANPPDCPPVNPPPTPVHEQYPLGDGDLVECVNSPVPMQRIHDCLFAGGGVWAQVGRRGDLAWSTVRIVESNAEKTIIKPWWEWGKEGPREELFDPQHKIMQLYLVHRWGA